MAGTSGVSAHRGTAKVQFSQFPVETADSYSWSSVFQIKYVKCEKVVYRRLITAAIVPQFKQDFGADFPPFEGMLVPFSAVELVHKINVILATIFSHIKTIAFLFN